MREKDRSLFYAITACFVSVCLVALASMLYSAHNIKVSERKWCDVVQTINASYRETSPERATERSRVFERKMKELAVRLGCEGG